MSDTFDGVEVEYGVPRDGEEVRIMEANKLDEEVKKIHDLKDESNSDVPPDEFGDDLDEIVIGEE